MIFIDLNGESLESSFGSVAEAYAAICAKTGGMSYRATWYFQR